MAKQKKNDEEVDEVVKAVEEAEAKSAAETNKTIVAESNGGSPEVSENNTSTESAAANDSAEAPKPDVVKEAAPEVKEFKKINKSGTKYSRLMAFPVEVILPMRIVAETGIQRRHYQIVSEDQEVPGAVIDWLKEEPRYAKWFKDNG